jgi:ATP-dependent helicase/nuclease subunit A
MLEMPFLVRLAPAVAEALAIGATEDRSDAPQLVEGVIDLAFEEADGWVIADYKTDVFSDETVRQERTNVYQRQVDVYASCRERLTGSPVMERVLVFTADGDTYSW